MCKNIIYLVDTENVSADGFVGIDELSNKSKIYYFFSSKSYRPSYLEIDKIRNAKCKVEFVESAKSGTNALDFQIVTFLGFLIGKNKKNDKTEYILITNDTGFDAVVEFWKKRNINVSRRDTIGEYTPIKNEETNEVIVNNDIKLEHSFNQLNSLNRKKLNYQKIITLSELHLPKDRYTLILSAIYKSKDAKEFHDKIKVIPNSQINQKTKERLYNIVETDFVNFRK